MSYRCEDSDDECKPKEYEVAVYTGEGYITLLNTTDLKKAKRSVDSGAVGLTVNKDAIKRQMVVVYVQEVPNFETEYDLDIGQAIYQKKLIYGVLLDSILNKISRKTFPEARNIINQYV